MPHAERWKYVFQSLQETRLAVTSEVTAYLKALGGGWKEGGEDGKEGRRQGASAAICVQIMGVVFLCSRWRTGGLWDCGSLI